MKFQSHNLTAQATSEHMDRFLGTIATRVLMTAPNAKEFRAIDAIFASVRRQIRQPLALVRLRQPMRLTTGHHQYDYPPGSLCVVGWGRIAIEVEEPEDASDGVETEAIQISISKKDLEVIL